MARGAARGPHDRIAALHNPLTVFEANDLSNVTTQDGDRANEPAEITRRREGPGGLTAPRRDAPIKCG
jgi:hypothetical protein